jgi:hypothetical protein
MSRQMKVALNLLTISTDPVVAKTGDVYFNTISKNLRIYNGTVWLDLTPGSTDPAPFYMHTHTYDGDVHTIDVGNKINFDEFNENSSVQETIPAIIGFDGGTPSSQYDSPSYGDLTLLDGGTVGN